MDLALALTKKQDQLRETGGGIMVDHYMGKELTMPMFCAPISGFSWQNNQCHGTLRWEDDPENDAALPEKPTRRPTGPSTRLSPNGAFQ